MEHETKEEWHMTKTAGILFILAVILSVAGAMSPSGMPQSLIWEIANMCSVGACALTAAKLVKDKHDFVSAGFAILIVAEGFNISTTANPAHLDPGSFAASILISLPGYCIIGIYSRFPIWVRICSLLLCIPFGIEFVRIIGGGDIDRYSTINTIAYALRSLTIIGFAIQLFRVKPGSRLY